MDNFPENYYCNEDRCGFRVSEIMKRAWAAQLSVLHEIDVICEKYNLRYYAYWGTLIGAIRHHGYIPWDDDIDIAMTRDDYIKFLEVAPRELPEEYVLQNMYTSTTYTNYFSTISSGAVIDCEEERLQKYHGFPFAVTLDIFPLYYIPRDTEAEKLQRSLLVLIGQLCGMIEKQKILLEQGNVSEELNNLNLQIAQGLVYLEKTCVYEFNSDLELSVQLTILYDQISRLYTEDESDYITAFPNYLEKGYRISKELFEPIIVPFENRTITVPKGYDEILRKTFGNYMLPVRGTATHDYPYFKQQISILSRRIELLDMKFKQSKSDLNEVINKVSERNTKKIILYYTSPSGLLTHSGYSVDKIRKVLKFFRENKDVLLWWYVCDMTPNEFDVVSKMAPDFLAEYNKVLAEYRGAEWFIMDESGRFDRAVSLCDAFYGDDGVISELFVKTRKPMMYQNYELLEM